MVQRIEAGSSVALRDGRSVVIRALDEHDRNALDAFGNTLPRNDILYLEDDFSNSEIISRLVNASYAENWRQIVATNDQGEIVAYAAALQLPGWSEHVADIRLIVSPAWRRSGLGRHLAQAIVEAARDLGVSKVIVDMLAAQTAGQAIFSRLGFAVEGQLARHAIDRDGNLHDIVIMSAFVRV
ncbi:MAG: GNAT family N-acetyltransferase [Oscillochloris sp.]|nr:GNAT family N-acetyltransferase [Oscillochloris sp.]